MPEKYTAELGARAVVAGALFGRQWCSFQKSVVQRLQRRRGATEEVQEEFRPVAISVSEFGRENRTTYSLQA